MLITKKINIKIANKNIEHFNNIGYNAKYGDIIEVATKDLMKSSKYKVKVVCDICGKEKEIQYQSYIKQHKNQKLDTCQICKTVKRKVTMLERYGVEHALQNKDSMTKAKNTMIKRYGAEFSANSIEIQEKNKKTCLEKYGVEYITQSEKFKNNSKKSKKERYNNEYYNNHNQIKETKKEIYNDENYNNREKSNETCLEKYGVENVSQSDIIKNKKKQTSFKNYGVEHPLKTFEIMEKLRNTNIDKLGVPYPTMSKIVTDKIFATNIKNGKWTKIEDRTNFYKYYLLVCKYTLQNKKELINNWNGNDYYTNEYILENFNLNSNDKNYPTIDHKKSVKYGFDNKISVEEISNITNLCITTRSNNSSKGEKIETEFNIYK
jgi:hypothetical protein